MKVKLLKKIRARYTMTYNPNFTKYPYKLTLIYSKGNQETTTETYQTKEEMFVAYRKSVIVYCGYIYGCYKQPKRQKPIETIKHCK